MYFITGKQERGFPAYPPKTQKSLKKELTAKTAFNLDIPIKSVFKICRGEIWP